MEISVGDRRRSKPVDKIINFEEENFFVKKVIHFICGRGRTSAEVGYPRKFSISSIFFAGRPERFGPQLKIRVRFISFQLFFFPGDLRSIGKSCV